MKSIASNAMASGMRVRNTQQQEVEQHSWKCLVSEFEWSSTEKGNGNASTAVATKVVETSTNPFV